MGDWRISTIEEVEDLVQGCCFMGTGGGGPPDLGRDLLKKALDKGQDIRLTDPSDVHDDAWVCTGAFVGSIAPPPEELLGKRESLGLERRVEHEIVEAVKELESFLSIKVGAIAACELGGINTPAPISAAAVLGIPAVDGDYAGRAIPASVQLRISIDGKSIWPRVFCDFAGNINIIKQASSHPMMERIQKYLSMTTIGLFGGAGHVLNGREMKRLINHGTISRSLNIGRLLREAREKGDDMASHVAREMGGWVLFKGVVQEKPWESKEGYMFGHYTMSGEAEFSGHQFRVWFQNENMISWLDDKPYVTCPDIISAIDLGTGLPPTNDGIKPNDHLAIIGLRALEFYRRPEGLKVLGPAFFGFDIPYRPIEEIMADR
jgi:DUF917 family protein